MTRSKYRDEVRAYLDMNGAYETVRGLFPGEPVAVHRASRDDAARCQVGVWKGRVFEVWAEAPTWAEVVGMLLRDRGASPVGGEPNTLENTKGEVR